MHSTPQPPAAWVAFEPHPILAAAPPTARLQSLAAAVLTYGLLASVGTLLLRYQVPRRPAPVPPTESFRLPGFSLDKEKAPPPSRVASRNRGADTDPGRKAAAPPFHPTSVPPDTPPERFPDQAGFRSFGEIGWDPRLPVKDGGTGDSPDSSLRVGIPAVVDLGEKPPQMLVHQDPDYPRAARLAHLEGSVELSILVDPEGRPVEIRPLSGREPFLAEAGRAVGQWRFVPATLGGRPVPARFRLTIHFRLRG